MTRKPQTIAFWRGRLPHWEVEDGRYFVTIHLAGAIPAAGRQRIHAIAAAIQKTPAHECEKRLQLQRRVFAEMESWLDRAPHNDQLNRPEIAQMVLDAISFREGREWRMFEFVVMPSHLHLFFETLRRPSPGAEQSQLKQTIEQFKRWTGHQAGLLLKEKWKAILAGRVVRSLVSIRRRG